MSDIVDTFKEVAGEQKLGFYHALRSFQALKSRKNVTWPILYLDEPKQRDFGMNRQGALGNVWNVFITILDRDSKQNPVKKSQDIVDNCRSKMNDFIQALRDKEDDHGRKIVFSMEGFDENELKQWSASVLSGVATPITITFVNPTFNCTT